MSGIIVEHLSGKRPVELRPAIGLDDPDQPGEAASHGCAQKHGALLTRQSERQAPLRFLRRDVHTGKGEDFAKDHRIHLNNGAGSRGNRHHAARLIGPAPRPQDIPFGHDLIDLGNRELDVLFRSLTVLNLLPTADVLTGVNRPDEAFDRSRNLPCPTWPRLGRGIALQKGRQSFDSDGLELPTNRFQMAIQSWRAIAQIESP